MLNKLKSYYEYNKEQIEYVISKLDIAILILYGLFVFEAFLRSTTFEINWHPYYHMSLKVILILLAFGKSLLKFMDNIPLYMLLGFCSVGFLLAYLQGNYGILLELILFTIAFVDIDFNKVITIFLAIISISLFIIAIGSQTNILNNLMYITADGDSRISFGIHYPTNFASYILFLCLAWTGIRKKRITFMELLLMFSISKCVYHYCGARTSSLCIILFTVILFLYKLMYMLSNERTHKISLFAKNISFILCLAVPFCILLSLLSAYLYSPDNKVLAKLNTYLTNRLVIGKNYFDTTDIKLFGQSIDMGGNGGFTFSLLNYSSIGKSGYNFIDSSYLSILLRYGLFVFICVMILFTLTLFVARKHHDYVTLIIIVIITVHSIMEHHLLDFNYNPFLFLLISSYYGRHINKNKLNKSDAAESENLLQNDLDIISAKNREVQA